MAVILSNQCIIPFLSKPMVFIKGLDPLGLQNTSESTYSTLLPGLNNVTGRIRYYGFYCWLLQEYSKRIGSTDPLDQRQFIRRAELIVALANRSTEDEVAGIPGSLYANRELKKELAVHDLKKGTYNDDGSTVKTYWQYPSGAFGQYYIGSLVDIGLISEREKSSGIYVRTPLQEGIKVSGEQLANAFDKNINSSNKHLFFECISRGFIETRDLDPLFEDFNLSEVPNNTEEKSLLIQLLTEKDYPHLLEESPQIFRKTTIYHVLKLLDSKGEITDRDFTGFAYQTKGEINLHEDNCLVGWYYYHLNELWQYANLGILNGLLDYLDDSNGANWKDLYSLTNEVCNKTIENLKREQLIITNEDSIEVLIQNITARYEETQLFQSIHSNAGIERIAFSFMLLISLYPKNINHLDKLKRFGLNNQVEKDGNCITYFLKFDRKLKYDIQSYIKEFLLTNIIFRHQYVAFRKMGGGIRSTQLFLIEDGYIRRLKNFDPTLTSPRILRLLRFLIDLKIIEDHSLSKTGENVFSTLSNEIA